MFVKQLRDTIWRTEHAKILMKHHLKHYSNFVAELAHWTRTLDDLTAENELKKKSTSSFSSPIIKLHRIA